MQCRTVCTAEWLSRAIPSVFNGGQLVRGATIKPNHGQCVTAAAHQNHGGGQSKNHGHGKGNGSEPEPGEARR